MCEHRSVQDDSRVKESKVKYISLCSGSPIDNLPKVLQLPVAGETILPLVETGIELHRHGVVVVLLI
jgi:hypothetical protein